jgi:hypothetical protein
MSDESRVYLFDINLRDGQWIKSVDLAVAEVA